MPDVNPLAARNPIDSTRGVGAWSLPARVLFRCSFLYLILTSLLWVFEFADRATAIAARPFFAIWRPMVLWVAVHLFHWSDSIALNFVRDTRYLYALLTCFLVVSVLAGLAWPVWDRKRDEYSTLHAWMRVLLRYVSVYLLLRYGMDKVFLLQFPPPTFARLTERVGDYSPSSLMWTFIGSSTLYTVFGGVAEILGAVLLLFRRTTTLGALIAFGVMLNVTVMDFSYDVAVKLLCLHILLMAIYLVVPDTQRLLNLFVLNRATQPVAMHGLWTDGPKRRIAIGVKACVIVYLLASITLRDWHGYKRVGVGAPRPPLYGLYEVEEYRIAGVVHPALVTDAGRWHFVMLESPGKLGVRRMDDSLAEYGMDYDANSHEMHVFETNDNGGKSTWKVMQAEAGVLQIQGLWEGKGLSMRLRPIGRNSFTLLSRDFHWISESSFIR